VRVITDSSPALGQTIMGFDPWERVSLAVPRAEVSRLAARRHAEPGFDFRCRARRGGRARARQRRRRPGGRPGADAQPVHGSAGPRIESWSG
jgi:hypothetical protein